MDIDLDDEKGPMLPGSSKDLDGENPRGRDVKAKRRVLGVHAFLLIGQLVVLAINVYWHLYTRSTEQGSVATDCSRQSQDTIEAPFSPARSSLEYEVRTIYTNTSGNSFTGEPRQEVDQAWSDLLYGTIVRITEEEMRRMNKTSSALQDGSGYAGYLEVYHMLHCVKRMYQFRHPEYYTDVEHKKNFGLAHWDHCVEILRQGIMCHADLTVNTYVQKSEAELKGVTYWPRKCVDWSKIQAWAEERVVPIRPGQQQDYLKSPSDPGSMGPQDSL